MPGTEEPGHQRRQETDGARLKEEGAIQGTASRGTVQPEEIHYGIYNRLHQKSRISGESGTVVLTLVTAKWQVQQSD